METTNWTLGDKRMTVQQMLDELEKKRAALQDNIYDKEQEVEELKNVKSVLDDAIGNLEEIVGEEGM